MFKALGQLAFSFGQIGLFSLGGGNSMIKLIEHECVTQRAWMTLDEYAALTGITFLFPGLTGIKIAGLIGYKVAGISGVLISMLALNLPGILLTFGFAHLIMRHYSLPVVQKLVIAVQYGALALLASALFSLAQPLWKKTFSFVGLFLTMVLFTSIAFFQLSPFLAMMIFISLYIICT